MSRVDPELADVTAAHPRRALPPEDDRTHAADDVTWAADDITRATDDRTRATTEADRTLENRTRVDRPAPPAPAPRRAQGLTAAGPAQGVYEPTVPRSALPAGLGFDDPTAAAPTQHVAEPAQPTAPPHPSASVQQAAAPQTLAPNEGATPHWFVPEATRLQRTDPPAQRADRAPDHRFHPEPARPTYLPPGSSSPDDGPGRSAEKTEAAPSKARTAATWVREIAVVVIIAMIGTSLVRAWVLQPFEVPSGSMENTLQISDKIVVTKAANFTRGDVVVFEDDLGWLPPQPETPSNPARNALEFLGVVPKSGQGHLVKRVVGMPGDVVSCCDAQGNLIVNGRSLDESAYLYPNRVPGERPVASATEFRITVPEDRVFVLGDHREDSADSRCHLSPDPNQGFIPMDAVLGPVNFIVAPVGRWTSLRPPDAFDSIPDAPGPAPPQPLVTSEEGC